MDLTKLRYWIAKPLLEALGDQYEHDLLLRYKEGYQTGFNLGHAIGQLQGQQAALQQLADNPELTNQEIERLKQGLVH